MRFAVECYNGGELVSAASFSSLAEAKTFAVQTADSGLFARVALLTERGDLLDEYFNFDGA